MPIFHLDFASPLFPIFAICLVATAAAVMAYRFTRPPVPPAIRALLITLRTAVLVLIVLLLGEPTLRMLIVSRIPPGIGVLVDDSRSMRIVDRAGDRAAVLRALLSSEAIDRIRRRSGMHFFTFGPAPKADPRLPADSLSLNEDATDISAALQGLIADKERLNLRAALLLTDGAYNAGRDPLHDAQQLGLPLYTVGIGDSAQQRDISIARVSANDQVYSGVQTPVDVIVQSSGLGGQRVELSLSEEGRVLARASLTLESGSRQYASTLSYAPEGEGPHKYTVRISTLPGELTAANNSRAFYATVFRSKLRILILSGQPCADFTTVRQTLREDQSFAVSSFAQKGSSGFYEGPLVPQRIDSTDCLVLIDMPTRATSPSLLEHLRDRILDHHLPLLYIGGYDVDVAKLNTLEAALPFAVVASSAAEQLVFFQPSDDQRTNPLLVPDPADGIGAWTKLPPLFRTTMIYRSKPDATVLGFAKLHNVTLPDPMMLTRSVAGGKSLACIGYGIWRWRLMAQGSGETAHLLEHFLQTAVRWLTVPEERRPLRVTPSKELFSEGEEADFTGQVYDAVGRPADDALVHVIAQSGSKIAEADLRSIGNGMYQGSLRGLPEGDYRFRATARAQGALLGEDKGKFSVGGLNLEYQDTRMNAGLLRELAYHTQGAFLAPSEIGALDSLLSEQASFVPARSERSMDLELWHWRYLLAGAVMLLVIEWIVRKSYGLL